VLVKSERAVLLQISREDFIERVLVLHPEVRKHLIRENEIKKQYHKKREVQLTKFQAL
jgi:hypothetical protein